MDRQELPSGIFLPHQDIDRPINWKACFGNANPLHLEIGFGLGEYLIQQVTDDTSENFVGIEHDWSRFCKCLSKISLLRSSRQDECFAQNVRLLRVDATIALERLFAQKTIDRVTCLFPCPWPKKSHIKYRLFSRDFMCLLNSRLCDNADVRIVTDWHPYLEWILEQVPGTGFIVKVETIKPRFNTKFERKWTAQGQEDFWDLLLVKTEDRPRPLMEDVKLRACFVKNFYPEKFQFEDSPGDPAVIYKDFIFDQKKQIGLVRLIVAEKFLTQHVWVAIIKTKDQWCIAKADGHSALPTSGVALAIEKVSLAVAQTGTGAN